MTAPVAGWYPDPSDASRLRWWDGTTWTDHTHDAVPTTPPTGSTTSAADASTAGTERAEGTDPTTPAAGGGWGADPTTPAASGWGTGAPEPTTPTTGGWGTAPSTPATGGWGTGATSGATPSWSSGTPAPSGAGNGKVLAIIAVVVLAVGGIVALVVALTGDDDTEVAATDPDEPSRTTDDGDGDDGDGDDGGAAPAAGGETLTLGGRIDADVPADGWAGTVSITEAGSYVVDVRGVGGFDTLARLFDGDVLVEENDDRGALSDRYGGTSLDALLLVDLAPGDYALVVEGYAGRSGRFAAQLTLDEPGDGDGGDGPTGGDPSAVAIELGASTAGTVDAGARWLGEVEITDAGTYGFDVVGDDGLDPIVTVEADGTELGRNDDRRDAGLREGGALDPYLELDLPPGVYTVIVEGWGASSGEFDLLVDQP